MGLFLFWTAPVNAGLVRIKAGQGGRARLEMAGTLVFSFHPETGVQSHLPLRFLNALPSADPSLRDLHRITVLGNASGFLSLEAASSPTAAALLRLEGTRDLVLSAPLQPAPGIPLCAQWATGFEPAPLARGNLDAAYEIGHSLRSEANSSAWLVLG